MFVVDVQPRTLQGSALETLDIIRGFLRATQYSFYVVATYCAEESSMFFKQGKWLLPHEQAGPTDSGILMDVADKQADSILVTKQVRSCFKCHERNALLAALKAHEVSEIHLVGYDVNDCVLATAYDAIDLGYYTYVIEEACNHHAGDGGLVKAALTVLRMQNMTNHSALFDLDMVPITGMQPTTL